MSFDLIGLSLTVVVIGLRYPHYVVFAAPISQIGQVIMAYFLECHVETILAAGAFSVATLDSSDFTMKALLALSGPLTNYIFGAVLGGVDQEQFFDTLKSTAKLRNPFAVINLRFAVVSSVLVLGQCL